MDLVLHGVCGGLSWKGREVTAEQGLAHAIEDILGAADLLKAEPERRMLEAASLVKPLQKTASQRGLAHATQTLDENSGGRTTKGALEVKNGAVTADEAVRILL